MDRRQIKETKKIVYEPNTRYEWKPDDLFTVTGAEIDIWNKALVTLVQSPEYQRFMVVAGAVQTMSNFIKEAVESGLMTKVEQEYGQTEQDSKEVSDR